MNTYKPQPNCQIKDVRHIADGPQETVPLGKSVRLLVRKILGPRKAQKIKKYVYNLLNLYPRHKGKVTKLPVQPLHHTMTLKAGDQVRVRSKDEIEATLDYWGQLKGCTFIPEMAQHCDTIQRVLKPVERFVDERDLRIRKTKGIVLLEGIVCQGTSSFGRCDRNCFYFWREEWLEKLEDSASA